MKTGEWRSRNRLDTTRPLPEIKDEAPDDQTVNGIVAFSQLDAVRKYMQAELERLNLINHTNKVHRIKEMFDLLVQAYKDVKFQGGLD